MESTNLPLVSVPVITYNSSKYVLETLESIKAQTYQNIELIISDDCSKDNTVELCRNWIDENKDRFVRTELITSEVNTGVSANLNRAEAACKGEWVKPIAGDDMLLSNCIYEYISYVNENKNAIYVFGKIKAFGASDEINKRYEEQVFDYSFFDFSINDQYERLVFGDNCVPAATCFYNRLKAKSLGIENDERIPLLEDWPKWIKVLEKGIRLDLMNTYVVKYRIHNDSLSTANRTSIKFLESNQLFNFYYRFPVWYQRDNDYAISRMVDDYVSLYKSLLNREMEIEKLKKSHAYYIGKFIIKPFKIIKTYLKL